MQRACFTFEIYPGQEAVYQRRHDEIWPEMVNDIREAGLRNYSLFRRGTQVVGYVECHPDIPTAFARMGQSEANARWAKWFQDVIVTLTDETGELRFHDEVWHLD